MMFMKFINRAGAVWDSLGISLLKEPYVQQWDVYRLDDNVITII